MVGARPIGEGWEEIYNPEEFDPDRVVYRNTDTGRHMVAVRSNGMWTLSGCERRFKKFATMEKHVRSC